jgi:sporulation protein YlmC with PRC-barrel domain
MVWDHEAVGSSPTSPTILTSLFTCFTSRKMQKLFSHLLGTEIINSQNGKRIARLNDLIIDPENGKILAIVINPNKNLIISVLDIVKWGKSININDPHSIIDGFEILKVKKIEEDEIKVLNSTVKTEDGKTIGNVQDYYIETDIGNLSKIITSKKFLFINFDERIIDIKDIVEIKKDLIIIKDDFKTIKIPKEVPVMPQREKLAIGRANLKETD